MTSRVIIAGMDTARTPEEILTLWPSRAELAADAGRNLFAAHRWHQRGRLWPAELDAKMLASAKARGIKLTADHLVAARAGAEQPPRPAAALETPRLGAAK